MYKIAFIVPGEEYKEQILKAFEEHNRFELESGIEKGGEYSCEVLCFSQTQDILNASFQSDILVARGFWVQELKKSGIEIPVIEIRITGMDIVQALGKSLRMYGNKTVGAIGCKNVLDDVESIGEVIGIKVKPYYVSSQDKGVYEMLVEQASQEGCDVILGGHTSYKYALLRGMDAVMLDSGPQATWQAITEAKLAANIMANEQEKLLRMKTIFDYSFEGIITTDRQNVITVMNNQAEQMLGVKTSEAIGKRTDDVILNSNFSNALAGNKLYINELMIHRNTQLTVNKVPLNFRGEVIGNVITFQDVTKIQEIEGKLRSKLYSLGHVAKFSFSDVIGSSEKTKEVINLAKRFANVNSNILIIGETGTGKEVFAQSIHNASVRKNGPFVAVNCAALPENLLESELFGYVEGAFTGAAKGGKPGLFELAHNGTIFLDEISELPSKLQGRLLRVIQERKIMRLGHDRIISVDVRIIAATNKDLRTLADKGEFREDLYFRLDVLKLRLPPLRQRRKDIRPLVENYIKQFSLEFGLGEVSLDNEAMTIMENYNWQGNIRELRNVCERLVVTAEGMVISTREVQRAFSDKDTVEGKQLGAWNESAVAHHVELKQTSCDLRDEVLKLEKERISEVLRIYDNNKVKAAKHLGISRTTLWRRMKECGLDL